MNICTCVCKIYLEYYVLECICKNTYFFLLRICLKLFVIKYNQSMFDPTAFPKIQITQFKKHINNTAFIFKGDTLNPSIYWQKHYLSSSTVWLVSSVVKVCIWEKLTRVKLLALVSLYMEIKTFILEQGSVNHTLWPKSWPQTVFVNKVLL